MKLVEPKARTRSISLHSLYIDIPSWLQKDLFSNHWRLFIHFLPKNFLQTQQRSTSSRRSCKEVVCLIPSFQKRNFFTQILISLKRNAFFAFLWSHMVTKLLNENLTSAHHTFTALCLLMYMTSLYCCYTKSRLYTLYLVPRTMLSALQVSVFLSGLSVNNLFNC